MQRGSVLMFLSGVAFSLAVMLSCQGHGHVTADANLADASPPDVADPSACCSSITVSGITRTVSADSDPAQLRSDVQRLSEGRFGVLLSGPFVVTTLLQNVKSSFGVTIELYLSAGSCSPGVDRQTFFTLTNLATANAERHFSGRFWIPAGTNLCFDVRADAPFDDLELSYSGFVPY